MKSIPNQTDGEEVAAKGRAKVVKPFSPVGLGLRPGSFGIAARLYQHAKTSRKSWTPKNVYASGLKGCARQQAMGIMGFTKTESEKQLENPHWNVVADFGSGIHDLLERWLKELGISIKSEYRVKYEVEGKVVLSGRVDSRVKVSQVVDIDLDSVSLSDANDSAYRANVRYADREAILDVKTVGSKDYRLGAHGPKFPGYIAQLSVYGYLEGLDTAIVLLVNRDSGEMQEIEFDVDREYAERMLRRAKGITDWAAQLRLPPAEDWTGKEGSFGCQAFCAFYRQCRIEQDTAGQYQDDQGREIGLIQKKLYDGVDPKDL